MDKQNAQQTAEFTSQLEELRKQLLDASRYFNILEGLFPTKEVVDVMNRYKGFFIPTRKAILDQFFIKICNVVSNDRRSPSFYKLFKMLDNDPSLAPEVNVQSLRKRLKQHRIVITKIDDYRNTRAAHWDVQLTVEKKSPLYGESKKMLKELEDLFNEISASTTKHYWSFAHAQPGVTVLLNHLNELMIIHKKRIDELDSMTKS